MASEKGGKWAKENLEYYNDKHFLKNDGSFDLTTNVKIITDYMLPYGLKQDNSYQEFPDLITFYPKEYFCPLACGDSETMFTENTVTIHHFAGSWMPTHAKLYRQIRKFIPTSFRIWVKKIVGKQ